MTAKLTIKHDSLNLAIVDSDKRKLSLAINRRGLKCSSTFDDATTKAVMTQFVRIIDADDDLTNGQKMEHVREIAESSADIKDFVAELADA